MNSAAIHELVINHFKTWVNFQPERYATDNVNFKTPLDGIWYRLTVQHGINLMVGMADTPCTRELGAVVVQIFYPNNQNTLSAKRLADQIGSHFQYYSKRGLECLTASVANVPERENGYQLNVRIPFRYDHIPLTAEEIIVGLIAKPLERLVNEDLPSALK
ncbi:phage tail terminator-like protein [Psychrobacter faecalis]|uniref:phage tail terminator-like protein n=1 Tax=Psychrobacter faecalis TaxID=180588 RepID=UPI003FD0E67C